MIGQIPYLAIDEKIPDLIVSDFEFYGTGDIVVPFDCIDITGERAFSGFALDEHVYISRLPLGLDGRYWLFYLKHPSVIDETGMDYPIYLEGRKMTNAPGAFHFFYCTIGKPFTPSKLNLRNKSMPFTYPTRQARTGVITGVAISQLTQNAQMIAIDDMGAPLSQEDMTLVFGGLTDET